MKEICKNIMRFVEASETALSLTCNGRTIPEVFGDCTLGDALRIGKIGSDKRYTFEAIYSMYRIYRSVTRRYMKNINYFDDHRTSKTVNDRLKYLTIMLLPIADKIRDNQYNDDDHDATIVTSNKYHMGDFSLKYDVLMPYNDYLVLEYYGFTEEQLKMFFHAYGEKEAAKLLKSVSKERKVK